MVSVCMRHFPIISGLILACTPAQVAPPPQLPAEATYRLELTDEGKLSLIATQVPVSLILAELHDKYGIAVEIPEFRDTIVTDRFVAVPLDSALRRVLPASRAHIVVLGRDWTLQADTGEKPGRRTARDRRLPRKDTTAVLRLDDSLGAKARPDTLFRPVRPEGAALKPLPDTTQPAGAEPKRPAVAVQDSARHLWLAMTLTATGRMGVEAARVLEGPRVVSAVPEGPYYYVVIVAGRPVSVGSFPDPFETRAYNPDPRGAHRIGRSDTARFVATSPWDVLASARPEDIDVRVFRLRAGAEPPTVDLARAPELMRVLEPAGRLEPGVLRAPLERALRPLER